MDDLMPEQSIMKTILRFNTVLKDADEIYVGKSKPGKGTKFWMTPAVKTSIKKRNRLRSSISTHRKEWLDTRLDQESEGGQLEKPVGRRHHRSRRPAMWEIINSLNGTPDTNSPNEAMKHKGRLITNNAKKANVFLQHYASVSKLSFSSVTRRSVTRTDG